MDCPRCGSELERYRLGDRESVTCPKCHYAGVNVEHGSPGAGPAESWDDALDRFRRRARQKRLGEEATTALASLELPGSDELVELRREAVGVLYERLKRQGSATKSDLLHGVDTTDLGYASPDTFWSSLARDAMRELPGVETPEPGGSTWRYTG